MHADPLKKRDRTRENFSRAMFRIMKRCDAISKRYPNADIYLLIRQNQRHYQYNSTIPNSNFPTPPAELVSSAIQATIQCLTMEGHDISSHGNANTGIIFRGEILLQEIKYKEERRMTDR